jgi:cytoskeletal protein CcmA (bactofilin family)
MKRLPIARLPPRRLQHGFLMPQLAVAAVVVSMILAYAGNRYAETTVNQGRDDKAKLIGERMANVSDATKGYATTFFTQIQRGESVTRNGYSVPPQRLLAPSLTDLSGLGFLPATATNPVVYNGQTIQFNVAMRVNTQSGCTVPTCSLLFQVTTSAPLLIPNANTVDIRRATIAAMAASPGNAGVSMPASMGGDPSVFVSGGGTVTGTNSGGVAGLVAMSNGYDSQGFFEFLRRDGSLPMTGTLNLQDSSGAKHNIANVNDIDAVNVTASGAVTAAGAITGKTVTAYGDVTAYGAVNAAGAVTGSTVSASGAVTGNTVTASGDITAFGGVNAAGAITGNTVTSAARLRTGEFLQLDAVVTEKTPCAPNGLVARNAAGSTLSCQSGYWKGGGLGAVVYRTATNKSTVDLSCAPGETLIGGGGSCAANSDGRMKWNTPNGNGWAAACPGDVVSAVAICAQ